MSSGKSFLDELVLERPESFQEEIFVSTRKRWMPMLVLGMIVVLIGGVYLVMTALQSAIVPEMKGWTLDKIQNWIKTEHINTQLIGDYSEAVPLNQWLSQDIKEGTKIAHKQLLKIHYAIGADPNKVIDFPNLKNMSLDEIQTWISTNQLSGVAIKYETNLTVPKDRVINYKLVDGSETNFLRKNRVTLYVSTGAISEDKVITMPDLVGKTKSDLQKWANENNVQMTIEESFNPNVEYGFIYKQSIPKDTKITQKDALVFSVSKGPIIVVPDFVGLSRAEASDLAKLKNLSVFFKYQKSTGVTDSVLSQDATPLSEVDQKQIITLLLAKDSDEVYVPDFTGLTGTEATSLATLYDLKVFVKSDISTEGTQRVVKQSVQGGKTISQSTIVQLTLESALVLPEMPNLVGMSKAEADVLAKNLHLSLVFNDVPTLDASNGKVLKTSVPALTRIKEGTTILVDVAVNSGVTVPDLTNMTRLEAESWGTQNNVKLLFVEQYHDTLPLGKLYEQSIKNQLLGSNVTVSVKISLGKISVGDYVGKSKMELIAWAESVNQKGGKVKLTFNNDYSSSVAKGYITTQNIASDYMPIDGTLVASVSAVNNQGTKIPDLTGMSYEEFTNWCNLNGIPYFCEDRYHDQIKEGKIYNQNYNNSFMPKGEFLKVYRSKGSLMVPDFTGQSKSAVLAWQKQVNNNAANIRIEVLEKTDSLVASGNVITQSVKGTGLLVNGSLTITVSKGPEIQ